MKPKTSALLSWIFYWVDGLLFLSLAVRLATDGSAPAFAPLVISAVLVLLVLVFHLLGRCERFLETHYTLLLTGFLASYILVQLINANLLRFQPGWDMNAIYQGAIDWAETGTFSEFFDYYSWFPNNLGGMALLAVFFSLAHILGITDYFIVACTVNALLDAAAILTAVSVCRKLLGVPHAVFSLVLFAASLPFWFMAPTFYTDSLSILFPVLVLFLYLKIRETEQWQKQLLLTVLLGVSAAVGTLIKATVLIMVAAVVLDSLLHRPWAQTVSLTIVSAAVVVAVLLGFQTAMYSSFLDRDLAQKRNTPYLHWVMMGLKGNGMYNPEDYEFTRSFDDPTERDAALSAEIRQRARDLGPSGLYRLFWTKTLVTFGSGTYAQSSLLDDNVVSPTRLHDFLLEDGESHETYRAACYVIWVALLMLAAVSSLQEVLPARRDHRKGKATKKRAGPACNDNCTGGKAARSTWNDLAPRTAVFGLLIFFACWETNGRLITNYIPVVVICSVMGVSGFTTLLRRTVKTTSRAFRSR